jgi:hypothetical protein
MNERDALERHFRARDAVRGVVGDVGAECWVCGPTAAALHGFDGFVLRRPFHVVVPRARNVRRAGVAVHTTMVMPPLDRETAAGLPVTSPTRTLIDIAAHETPPRLAAALGGALRDGLTSEDLLHRRIAALRTKGRYGIPNLLDVLAGREVTRGGRSWLEREFLRLAAAAALPRPDTQAVLARRGDRYVRVDCRFPGTPVVIELLCYRFHRTAAQMAGDAERLNALLLEGLVPFQFTYAQVVTQPDQVIATTHAALAQALAETGVRETLGQTLR